MKQIRAEPHTDRQTVLVVEVRPDWHSNEFSPGCTEEDMQGSCGV